MVQTAEQFHEFAYPLPLVILSHNQRFPSPLSPHILSSDVLSRTVTPYTIHTTRLVLKRGKMPKWAPGMMKNIGTSWVLEDCLVDYRGETGEMVVVSRNVDHRGIMLVYERQLFFARDDYSTHCQTNSSISSSFKLWPLRTRLEKFGLNSALKSIVRARDSLGYIASIMSDPIQAGKMLESGPLRPYAFEDVGAGRIAGVGERVGRMKGLVMDRLEAAAKKIPSSSPSSTSSSDSSTSLPSDPSASGSGEEDEPGKIWRDWWRGLLKTGLERVRGRIGELRSNAGDWREVGSVPTVHVQVESKDS